MQTRTQIKKHFFQALAIAVTTGSAVFNVHAGDACAFLRTPDVERALPLHTPWKDISPGSSSACRFTNDIAKPTRTLSISQRFHNSSADAVDITRKLRSELEDDYVIESAPELGRESFYYTPREDADEQLDTRTTRWVVQQQRLVLMGKLVVPTTLHAEEKAALGDLLRKVVDAAQTSLPPERVTEEKTERNEERSAE